jgi:hypothetical protein
VLRVSSPQVCTYHLVDDIPGVDLTLVAAHQRADVVLHDSGQGGLVPDGRNPAGQLRVPHGGVTAEELAVVLCELGGLVGSAEVERTTRGLSGIPLHATQQSALHTFCFEASRDSRVLGCDLTEVRLDDGTVLSTVEAAWVGAGTEVLPALCLHRSIDALSSLALIEEGFGLSERRSRNQRGGGQDGDERKLHGEFELSRLLLDLETVENVGGRIPQYFVKPQPTYTKFPIPSALSRYYRQD